MTNTNLSAFLAARGLHAAKFPGILTHFDGKTVLDDSDLQTKIIDVMPFDGLTVVLTNVAILHGFPGIRRGTLTKVFRENDEVPSFVCEDVYVDGLRGTRLNDLPDRAFTTILGAQPGLGQVTVRVKGIHNEYELVCAQQG